MPRHPKKLYEEFKENPNLKYPYKMNDEEKKLYQQFSFALNQYHTLIGYLSSTSESVDPETDEKKGYGRSDAGMEKPMDEEMMNLLTEKVSKVIATGQSLFSKVKENPKLSKDQKLLMFDIQHNLKIASNEISVLETLAPDESISYTSMHAKSTDVIIDVGEDKLESKAGQASTRMMIRYIDESGKVVKGFFTENEERGISGKPFYDEAVKNSPGMKKLLTILGKGENKDDPKFFNFLRLANTASEHFWGSDYDSFRKFINDIYSPDEKTREALQEIRISDDEIKAFSAVCKRVYDEQIIQKTSLEDDFHQVKGSNANLRNNAMSEMATALGMPHIIAKSTTMTLIKNGEAVEGSFMANAKGLDIDVVSPDMEVFNGQEILIDYDKVVKDCADLMVLDYICLNGDRHQNNQFYIIENINGSPTLTGFQGIDNDLSFGNHVPNENERAMKLPPLNDIKFITRKTADMVNRLSEGGVRSILTGKELSEEEIKACCERVKKMQNYIKSGKVEIIEGKATKGQYDILEQQANEYERINVAEQDDPNVSQPIVSPMLNAKILQYAYNDKLEDYKQLSENEKTIANMKQRDNERKERIKNGLKSLKQKVYIDEKQTMKGQQKKVGKLLWKLPSPRWVDSREYKKVYEKIENLNKALKVFQNKKVEINGHTLTNDNKANLLADKFKEAQESIRQFVSTLPDTLDSKQKKILSSLQAMDTVCIDASNSRERQVTSLNNAMVKCFTELGRVHNAYTAASTDFEKSILKMELEAKQHLGSFVGNCEQPTKEDMKLIKEDLAKILIATKLQDLKVNDPRRYEDKKNLFDDLKNTNEEPFLDGLVQDMLNNSDFQKIAKNVNPINALINNTTSEVQNIAEDMNLFNSVRLAGYGPDNEFKSALM